MRKKSIQQTGMPTERYDRAIVNCRIIIAVFLLAALLFVGGATAATYNGTCGENLTWTLTTETGLLEITGTGEMTDYSSSERTGWFQYRDTITTVSLNPGVTSIGDRAFYDCTSLTSVIIPEGVTSIGQYAFSGCTALPSVAIPASVTSIGQYAFYSCYSLTSVIIPDGIISIEDAAFFDCTSLASVVLPDSVESIGWSAFRNCPCLTSVNIPDGVTSIGQYAFAGTALTSVAIPEGVTSIGDFAFTNCRFLTSVIIPDGVMYIRKEAFSDCISLKNVTLGKNVTTIEKSAFSGCTALFHLTIPENVRYIGESAFNGCHSLTSVVIPVGVTSIEPSAFYGCHSLTSVVIPEGVTSIGDSAFSDCTSLTSVVIPEGVTSIGKVAFGSCTSLTSIEIPDSVISIGYAAFSQCTSLTSVVIPERVTSIEGNTFQYCTSLTSINIPDSVTSIGDGAFYSCSSLISIVIPDCVISIGNSAFNGCTSLTSVVIPEGVTSIGWEAFFGCVTLNNVTIGPDATSIGESAFSYCSNLQVVDLSRTKSISSVGNAAFGNTNLDAMKSGSVIYVSDENVAALFIDGTNYYAPNTTIVVNGTTPVVLKFTIETSSPSEILLGENITVSGIAEGTDSLRYYVLAPYYSSTGTLQVASDGSYTANFSTSRLRVDSPCFVVIQHPMYDAIFNVAPVHNELTNNYTCAYQNNTARPSGGTGDIFLFNMTNTTGMYAFEKICQGIDDPANDDLELNVTFTVRKGDPAAGSLVYIYQNAALKSNTTYYQWVDGNPAGSVTTNFNGTLIGEGIAEGLYSSSSTSPADLFTLKYPMINLSAYLNNTSIPISGRNIPKNQTIDFNVSGNNGLYYALRFLSPDGNSTFTFGNTTFNSYNITKNPEMLNKVSLTNVTPGIWKVYAVFYDSPDSYNTLNTYTPSVYKCSEVIRFDVGTAEPWIFTAVPESPEVSKGNEIVITGTAENTGGTLRYYVFSDHYTIIKRIPVNNDGSYKVNFSTVNLSSGSCFVIIQHPMYDGIFNIGPVHNILTDNFLYIYQNNTAQPTGEDGDIFLVNISNTTGFPAFEIVRQGIDDPANDDRELNVTFRITSVSNDTTLSLTQGWNFISVPKTLNATKNTAGSLFGSVDTSGKNILGYNAQTEMWTPVTAAEIIRPLNGYWIYAAAGTDITLSYPSDPASPTKKILYPGWNAVGLSSSENTTAHNALVCLNSSWKTVIPWNLSEGQYDSAIVNGGSGANSPDRLMTLGNGYWIYVDSQSTLTALTA